jgi:hypothetical protein
MQHYAFSISHIELSGAEALVSGRVCYDQITMQSVFNYTFSLRYESQKDAYIGHLIDESVLPIQLKIRSMSMFGHQIDCALPSQSITMLLSGSGIEKLKAHTCISLLHPSLLV